MPTTLYYIHDPMCSWCWGFSSALTQLLENLPAEIKVIRLLGGLAVDSDEPMPESMKQYVKTNWSRIEDRIPGVKFNFDFWSKCTPRRSTYPACRAVIAARKQGAEYDLAMTKAIQQAYYREALNPSDKEILISLAEKLGLNKQQFISDIESNEVDDELMAEIEQARELFVESYPNLVLVVDGELFSIPLDYINSSRMLDAIKSHLD